MNGKRSLRLFKTLLVFFSFLLAHAINAKNVAAQWRPERGNIWAAYVSSNGGFVPLWVAVEKGYFKEYGLTVQPVFTRTVSGVQALISGDVQFLYSGCSQIMAARKAGTDHVIIYSGIPYNLYTIASRRDITDSGQLVGKKLAVNQLGDTTHLSARFALQEAGINPDSVIYVGVGGTPARLAALNSGSVDAALQGAENVKIVKSLGMNILINLFEKKIPYCNSAIGVSRAFMQSNPQTVEAFFRGLVRGNAFARLGNPDAVKAIMAKYMRVDVKSNMLSEAYNFYPKQVIDRDPVISRDGLVFIIDQLASSDKTWLDWKPEQFYDATVLAKLKREGFLDEVYKQLR